MMSFLESSPCSGADHLETASSMLQDYKGDSLEKYGEGGGERVLMLMQPSWITTTPDSGDQRMSDSDCLSTVNFDIFCDLHAYYRAF